MTKQVWLPVDGALLKKLREAAGVEVTTLARLHSLSSSQIKQLENGGDSSFYTPSIKLATGRKLLMHFDADVQPLEEEVEINQTQTSEPEITAAIDRKSIDTQQNRNSLQFQIIGVLVVIIVIALSNGYLSSAETETKPSNLTKQSEITKSIAENTEEPKSIDVNSEVLKNPSIKTTNLNVSGCEWSNQAKSIAGYQPTKPGDYVHVVANSDGAICVKDATSKLQVLNLKNSQSQTVRGSPPFEIFSNNLHQFQLFYQGNLLKLPSNEVKNITLEEQKI
jgi:transcriptional regulator with XRE-family HTH domain